MSDDLWKKFSKWKELHDQHGKQAFTRFIMLNFLDGLEKVSDEFIFKGGNLLWHYIKTPRETTDLDLSTLTLRSHDEVLQQIESSFSYHNEIDFFIKEFVKVDKGKNIGARIIIGYQTDRGQRNQFQIDVVYSLAVDLAKVKSTINEVSYKAASIENIIADKMDAALRFGSGNTRIKDFDDLWRISKSNIEVDKSKLLEIFKVRGLSNELPLEWADYMSDSWKAHNRKYRDVPKSIHEVFEHINEWLDSIV